MLTARHGGVLFDGLEVIRWPIKKVLVAGIAYVPQGRCNFPGMSVHDNLLVSLDHRRQPAARQAGVSLDAAYAEFPMLADKRGALAGNLSGGQQQILEMAMALLQEP